MTPSKVSLLGWCAFGFCCVVVVGHLRLLGSWLIDDAGISWAYARNLVENGRLIPQRGTPPVEGFSNPLWVLVMCGLQWTGSPLLALKAVGSLLLVASCFRLVSGFSRDKNLQVAGSLSAMLLVLQPSVVIWTLSGLENSLYLFAGVELMIRASRAATGRATRGDRVCAGIAASCLALTRPEGIGYAGLYYAADVYGSRDSCGHRRTLTETALPPLLVFITYLVFRRTYFGEWLPNTYYAKGGLTISRVTHLTLLLPDSLNRLLELARSIFGWRFQTWGALGSIALVVWAFRNKDGRSILGPALLAAFASIAHALLPGDWMGENRYATLFFPGFFVAVCYPLVVLARKYTVHMVICVVATSSLLWVPRTIAFTNRPPMPLDEVRQRGERFLEWGERLGVTRPSVMTADVGGLLVADVVDVVDLGMLCDRRIAQSLGEGSSERNISSFHDYVFVERRPTFIATRAHHAWTADLERDPRFRQDYTPIREYLDRWVEARHRVAVTAGDFVRNDVVASQLNVLGALRNEARLLPYTGCGDCPTELRSSGEHRKRQ